MSAADPRSGFGDDVAGGAHADQTGPARRADPARADPAHDDDPVQTDDPAHVPESPLTVDPMTPGALPLPMWFGVLAAVCALGLVPWIVYLAYELPGQSRSAHYDITWVGFDIAMFLALGGTAWATVRHSTWTEPLATITAVLLLTDAWFDITSANHGMDRMEAVASGVLIEVPLAILCGWVAQNTERLRRRGYRRLWRRATEAERELQRTAAGTRELVERLDQAQTLLDGRR